MCYGHDYLSSQTVAWCPADHRVCLGWRHGRSLIAPLPGYGSGIGPDNFLLHCRQCAQRSLPTRVVRLRKSKGSALPLKSRSVPSSEIMVLCFQGDPHEQFHGSPGTAEMPSITVCGHTCTENSRLPAACESESSSGIVTLVGPVSRMNGTSTASLMRRAMRRGCPFI